MDISSQLDILEKNFERGIISEEEYDEAMDDLIKSFQDKDR